MSASQIPNQRRHRNTVERYGVPVQHLARICKTDETPATKLCHLPGSGLRTSAVPMPGVRDLSTSADIQGAAGIGKPTLSIQYGRAAVSPRPVRLG
jgi:hypothetical protein